MANDQAAQRAQINFNTHDAFLAYCRTGDLTAASVASGVPIEYLELVSRRESWPDKLTAIRKASPSDGNGATTTERVVNRAVSFVTGSRLRLLVDLTVSDMLGRVQRGEKSAAEFFTTVDKAGNPKFDLKCLSDLARAAQTADATCYRALGDTVTERIERQEPDNEGEGSGQLSVLEALSRLTAPPDASGGPGLAGAVLEAARCLPAKTPT